MEFAGSQESEPAGVIKPTNWTQRGRAATKDEKINFTTKVTKSTKLKNLEISMSETFVAFVYFVVR